MVGSDGGSPSYVPAGVGLVGAVCAVLRIRAKDFHPTGGDAQQPAPAGQGSGAPAGAEAAETV